MCAFIDCLFAAPIRPCPSARTNSRLLAQAVIMVIDSSERERTGAVKEELTALLGHEDLRDAALCVFANKQDLKGSMTAAEITEALSLHSIKTHDWQIQPCCALTGDGISEGLDWIVARVNG